MNNEAVRFALAIIAFPFVGSQGWHSYRVPPKPTARLRSMSQRQARKARRRAL